MTVTDGKMIPYVDDTILKTFIANINATSFWHTVYVNVRELQLVH